MYLSVNIEPEKTKELEWYIKAVLPEIINEKLFEDKNKLNAMIRECVKGQIMATINNLMQEKEFRIFLRDKIMEQIGMKENKNV